jgi:hypothetical protein
MVGWIAAAAAAFALLIYLLAFGGGGPQHRAIGPSAYSRSAIGYFGWAELMSRVGITVVKTRNGGIDSSAAGKLLVLADPSAASEDQGRYAFGNADRVLVVLPKWSGFRSMAHSGWISDAALLPIVGDDLMVKKTGATGKMARLEAPPAWTVNTLGLAPEITAPVQVIQDTKLRPIIAAGGNVLVGELADRSRRIWIVSDPDMLSNHGLFSGRNAEFAIRLVNALRPAKGDVVFSEVAAGYAAAPSTNPLTLMFQFPFIIVTIQLLAASAFLLWAAMPRFGLPMPAPEPIAAGKRRLIQNAANLLRFSSHPEIIVASYVRLSVRGVARELRSPPGLDWQRMVEWLGRVGASRGVAVDFPGLIRRTEELAAARPGSARSLVDIVSDTYRWKREILNGP